MATEPERRLLVIEDDDGLRSQLKWCFDKKINVSVAGDPDSALRAFERHQPGVVTLDLGLPPDPGGASEGFRLLETLLGSAPATRIIVVTGREERDHAIRAIAAGAFDYYQKPVDVETLNFAVERAFRIAELEAENARLARRAASSPLEGLIATSDAMLRVTRLIERIAPTDVSALLLGETGTGKEVLARALHSLSGRATQPFQTINCAAIPENLLESELFGHEKGAFTGAADQKKGKIERADGGTLFLDEIGDMPFPLQAKILRFLQERVVERVGGHREIPVDVRVIAATHRDLPAMIQDESFREDLYYRLSAITVDIPPLRKRPEDVALIATAFLQREASRQGRSLKLAPDAIQALQGWHWPGNVREMENRIKRAAILADGRLVTATDLELDQRQASTDATVMPLREAREQAEKATIVQALALAQNNITQAARMLEVTRPTLYNLMGKYGLASED